MIFIFVEKMNLFNDLCIEKFKPDVHPIECAAQRKDDAIVDRDLLHRSFQTITTRNVNRRS